VSGSVNGDKQPLRKARVLIEVNGKIVNERQLDKPVLTVGRLPGNDVQIPSQRVSRLHAKIRWVDGGWLIEDADSLNGLTYQGQRVDQHMLNRGDRIYMAPSAAIQYEPL
jgi:pSer/pThr/pTyr-binding forkhead associated (FHA) protein